jgi:hypothetical protein
VKQTPPKFKYPLSWHHMKSLISHSHTHTFSLSHSHSHSHSLSSLSLCFFFPHTQTLAKRERKKSEILTCTFQSEIYWPIPKLCIFSPFALKDSTWGQYSIEDFSVRFPCFLNLLFVSFLISEKQILMNILFPNLKCKTVIALIFFKEEKLNLHYFCRCCLSLLFESVLYN